MKKDQEDVQAAMPAAARLAIKAGVNILPEYSSLS